ncbi:(3R)-3-hydroxyacyl-CoA dehydrogenase-like [Dermacentor albipictus]|uniref:(3R)-3-hydroxyacyl-CoA dehydrogenase-like n=1 Tax=Dermacentor albipictus TaxID=60249 RepID=UPI0031FD0D0B
MASGTVLVTRPDVHALIASGVTKGAVVKIVNMLGKTGNSGLGAYTTSKGGVLALTKAQELAPPGFRCNAALPSLTQTLMADALPEESHGCSVPSRLCGERASLKKWLRPSSFSVAHRSRT